MEEFPTNTQPPEEGTQNNNEKYEGERTEQNEEIHTDIKEEGTNESLEKENEKEEKIKDSPNMEEDELGLESENDREERKKHKKRKKEKSKSRKREDKEENQDEKEEKVVNDEDNENEDQTAENEDEIQKEADSDDEIIKDMESSRKRKRKPLDVEDLELISEAVGVRVARPDNERFKRIKKKRRTEEQETEQLRTDVEKGLFGDGNQILKNTMRIHYFIHPIRL